MIDGHGQSDGGIVPREGHFAQSSPNNPEGAEGKEGRPPVKGNAPQGPSHRTQSRTEGMQMVLRRIREAVRKDKEAKLTALYHHVYNVTHLREAYFGLKKQAAPGVDGET